MDGWVDGWIEECMDGVISMYEQINGCMYRWIDAWTGGWIEG